MIFLVKSAVNRNAWNLKISLDEQLGKPHQLKHKHEM